MGAYLTIAKEGEGQIREKMSRFLAFAMHIDDAEEAKIKIKEYQNRFHDSRHVCWAYMLGAERNQWQLNDNGEPSGTAGKPILGQINSKNLTDVLVIVVRYFGGIKLGTSGLIVAYREAAKLAIENSEIEERHEMSTLNVEFAYEDMNNIMKIIKSENLKLIDKQFDNICRIKLLLRKNQEESVARNLRENGGKVEEK